MIRRRPDRARPEPEDVSDDPIEPGPQPVIERQGPEGYRPPYRPEPRPSADERIAQLEADNRALRHDLDSLLDLVGLLVRRVL